MELLFDPAVPVGSPACALIMVPSFGHLCLKSRR
jgi:hypothetical protein